MPQLTSNFILRSKQPNFERDSFKTEAEMAAVQTSWIDEGHISYCEETGKHYRFNSTDGQTGMERWTKLFSAKNIQEYLPITVQDIFVVDSVSKLNDKYITDNNIGLGKLIYVQDINSYYFSVYDKDATVQVNDYQEGKTGWFHPLISDFSFQNFLANSKYLQDNFLAKNALDDALKSSAYLKSDYVSVSQFSTNLDKVIDNCLSTNTYLSKNYVGTAVLTSTLGSYITEKALDEVLNEYVTEANIDNILTDNTYLTETYATRKSLGLDSINTPPSGEDMEEGEEIDHPTYTSMAEYIQQNYVGTASFDALDERVQALENNGPVGDSNGDNGTTGENITGRIEQLETDVEELKSSNNDITNLRALVDQLNSTISLLTARIKTLEENAGIEPPKDNLAGEGEYTVAGAINLYNVNGGTKVSNATVCGYIVGAMTKTTGSPEFTIDAISAGSNSNTNFIMADNPNIQDIAKCMVVQLPSGTIRDELNLQDNPDNHKKPIKVTGSLESYFSAAGIKNTKSYSFID